MSEMKGYNVFNTIFYSANLMSYFEKPKILEIFTDLMILIGKVRPENIEKFIAENIKEVEDKFYRRLTLLLIPSNFGKYKIFAISFYKETIFVDVKLFAETYFQMYGGPILQFNENVSKIEIFIYFYYFSFGKLVCILY